MKYRRLLLQYTQVYSEKTGGFSFLHALLTWDQVDPGLKWRNSVLWKRQRTLG